ncbi:putative methyltransferase NSUN7 isoform X2 [Betta splendens]|uniref:Methyltransferase NSUN7 isoform X2 n=1 Tax=Betta splendens TaxID=158456 RepID=A0A6P7NKA4_BETSP|nr:putative methyltransferase NSUN7 isoform X2 [Betta splendens]
MVKNKKRSTKTKKASSEAAGSKGLPPLDDPASSEFPAAPPELQAAAHPPLGLPDKVYLLASVIFQNNHPEKPAAHRLVNYGKERGLPLPEVKDGGMHCAAYELAFNTLKYQELLEDIMVDSGLYLIEAMPDDQMGLVAVMLYDFQDRKFLPREHQDEEEETIQKVRNVEKCLLRWKTKLAASLARCRIKQDLLSIHCILPESVKMKQERSSSLLVYAWVNTLKSSYDEVQSVLKSSGFSQVKCVDQLQGRTFCQDTHCRDVLVFPALLKAQLYSTKLLSDHKLIIQDKACSLGPYAVCSVLPDKGDVLIVGCFSGSTVSHTASLIAEKHNSNGTNSKTAVYVCVSDRTTAEREELQQEVTAMGCKNVTLITEDFQSLNSDDKWLQKVRVILLTPKCSLSAVSNPVEFIVRENGDTDLLQDLSQGSVAQSKLEALVTQQTKDIDHALKFPKVLALVYSTCSSYPEENEGVVSRALEQAKARCEQEGEPQQADFRSRPSVDLFSCPNHAGDSESANPYFILEPSERSNGCFLAVLTRELVSVKEAPQEVVARANAKGLLDKISCSQPSKKEQHRHNPRIPKASQTRLSFSNRTKQQVFMGSNSTTLCGHQEFTSRRQSNQGKPTSQRSQGLNHTVPTSSSSSSSSCRGGNTTPTSFKPENRSPSKSITFSFNTAVFNGASLHPAPPAAPVARARKARQEVLKPVVLVLPPVHFPDLLPPLCSRTGFSTSFSYSKWRSPSHTIPRSSHGLLNDILVKSRPLF